MTDDANEQMDYEDDLLPVVGPDYYERVRAWIDRLPRHDFVDDSLDDPDPLV